MSKSKKYAVYFGLLLALISATYFVAAFNELVDMEKIKLIALPLHIIELILALFICYMALKLFRITKPVSLFLIIYIALGFFIINSFLYILFYFVGPSNDNINFVNVYLGSRIALIGMLVSLSTLFYYLDRQMRMHK